MQNKPNHFELDDSARLSRHLRGNFNYVTKTPTRWERCRKVLAYGVLAVGVFTAVYVVTPARAGGSMGHDVKIIRVSPSVSVYGNTREERKMKADVVRDNNRHSNVMELEELRGRNERALEADRAYYRKLADQRKTRK